MEDFPNVMIIPANEETPEEIIEDYVEMIKYNLEHNVPLNEILWDFFYEINRWTAKQFLIDSAKQSLHELENIHKIESEFVEDLDEDDY